jgi:Zn-dependent peptidase ImmA (M78 family)
MDRLRHSLCHELGHVVMHRIPRPEVDIEKEADAFAAELLMPAAEIGSSLYNAKLHTLAQLKPYWKTAMSSLLVRASRLKKITKNQEKYLWMQMAPYRHREPAELDIPAEEPKALRQLIDIYLKDYSYSLPQLSKVVGLNPHEFQSNYLGEERHLRLVKMK